MRSAIPILAAMLVCMRGAGLAQQPAPKSEVEKAVEEFKLQTRNLGLRADSPRRQGRAGPSTAKFHGRLFENFRNDFLDAVPHEVTQNGGTKSLLRRNQFGFNISGPVVIPRLFRGSRGTHFSVSYEGVREGVSRSYLRTIPTLPERVGDFSETVDQAGERLPIYDPQTTRPNPGYNPAQAVSLDNLQYLRDPFPGNRLPAVRLDAVAVKALPYYPAPNASVGPFFRNNYFILSPETNIANGMIGRVDHAVRERHRFNLGLSYSNGLQGSARWFPSEANPGPPERNYNARRGSIEHVFTYSPRTVNTFTFEAVADRSRNGDLDQPNYASQLGIGGIAGRGFPVFYISPYLSMGRANPVSQNVRNTFVWTDSFSTRQGKHGFRMTAQLIRVQVNTFWPEYPAGYFSFSPGLTSLPGIVNTGYAFASFLLGGVGSGGVTKTESPSYYRRLGGVLALGHSYEAAKGVNFHLGLSLHGTTPRVEKFDRQSTVDLDVINPANGRPGALVAAGRGGRGRTLYPTGMVGDASASIAWNPRGDAKTVVRLSYGRSHSIRDIYFGHFGTQGFNGIETYASSNVQLAPVFALSDGVPPATRTLPDLRPEAANDTFADVLDVPGYAPTYQSASLSLERELPGAVVLSAGLGYAGGRNLFVSNSAANLNALPLETLQYRDRLNDDAFNRSLRPYPQYRGLDVSFLYPLGRYQRDAGHVRLEKRTSGGLAASATYEFSRQWDDYSGPYGKQDYFNRRNEWSLTPGQTPQRLVMSYMYELPLGSNKALLRFPDWRKHMVDGWSVSGSSTLFSGDPLALRPQYNNTGGVISALHVNVVPGVEQRVKNPSAELWYNPAAFDQPADFTLGTVSRTHPFLRAPGYQNHDVSLTKRFALAADRTLEFSAVGLNFANHANLNDPDVVIGPADAPNVNAGKIIGTRGGRVIQLGLRYSF